MPFSQASGAEIFAALCAPFYAAIGLTALILIAQRLLVPADRERRVLVIGNKQDEKVLSALVSRTHGRIVTLPLTNNVESTVAEALANLRPPPSLPHNRWAKGEGRRPLR